MPKPSPSNPGKLRQKFYKEIGGTEAMSMANVAYADLIKEGACDGRTDTGPESDSMCNAFLDADGKVVSAIWWKFYNSNQLAWILQAWTDKRYRRQGLNNKLFQTVCKRAKRSGCKAITGNILASNKAMVASAVKQGRTPTFVRYELKF